MTRWVADVIGQVPLQVVVYADSEEEAKQLIMLGEWEDAIEQGPAQPPVSEQYIHNIEKDEEDN